MGSNAIAIEITCGVEVFIATALLHREQPERTDFTIKEIVERAESENIRGKMRPGVSIHASQHCVANKPPSPAKLRMLLATGTHTRRLLMPGDQTHPERTGRVFPDPGEVPPEYIPLLEWAKKRYEDNSLGMKPSLSAGASGSGNKRNGNPQTPERWLESLFELEGLGKEHWKDVDPDEFVRQLREGWE